MPEEAPDSQLAEKELEQKNERKLNTVLHAGAVAQMIVGVTVILAVCYVAKLVLVTLLVSILLAFMLEPRGEPAGKSPLAAARQAHFWPCCSCWPLCTPEATFSMAAP